MTKPIRTGGGVYIYRTRKPASFFGWMHKRIGTRWWVFPIAAAWAGTVLHLLGAPWWWGLLFLFTSGRHFGYVGETVSFKDRHAEHIQGGGRWKRGAQPWSDLDPVCIVRLPLPKWKWLLHFVEKLLIFLLAPVYNHKGNLWNPRRITLQRAKRQRRRRERREIRMNFNLTTAHLLILFVIASVIGAIW
jgi:hypothetical protein